MDWRSLIYADDPGPLADAVGREFGIDVPAVPFRAECLAAADRARTTSRYPLGFLPCGMSWSESTWRSFVRVRAISYARPGKTDPDVPFITAILHIFFVSIEETPDMIDRLRAECVMAGGPARSRISRTTTAIRPIDATADRVTGGKFRDDPLDSSIRSDII